MDSKALLNTVITLQDNREYRLRKTVARIRCSFEAGYLDAIRWIPAKENLADDLTKRNIEAWRKLNKMFHNGLWSIDTSDTKIHESSQWK